VGACGGHRIGRDRYPGTPVSFRDARRKRSFNVCRRVGFLTSPLHQVWVAFGDRKVVDGVAGLLRTVLLLVPVVGSTLLFLLVGKRLGTAVRRWSEGNAMVPTGLVIAAPAVAMTILSFAVGFTFWETILSPVWSAASAVFGALPQDENFRRRLLGLGIIAFILLVTGLGAWKLPMRRDRSRPHSEAVSMPTRL
jgi:hypothetical protein